MKYKLLKTLSAVILFIMPAVSFGQVITLGTAANFVLFTTNGAMTNAGVPHLTHLTGNVGSNLAGSISGFGNVDGQMHAFDAVTQQCVVDVNSTYSQLNAVTPTAVHPVLLGGETLAPGVYHVLANATLNGTLTLDALGNPNAVFIFQIDGTFSTTTLSKVKMINGGLACNVYWKIEGLVSMVSGTTMVGTIVAHNAAINMSALDTLEGRALSINGAVGVNALMAYKPIGCGSTVLTGPAAPALVSAAQFGVFSSIGAVTSTPITYVTGDVGSNSTTTTGFNPLFVTGVIHTPPDAATAAAAGSLTNAYNYLLALPADIELTDPANFGFDLVLTPHTYHMGAVTMLNGNVILNAQGNPDAVFVIQINGAFSTTPLSKIILTNGTQAKNVYWKIDGAVHVFPNSLFNGTIVADGAITFDTGDTLNGRALTIGGAIAINGSYVTINPPPCEAAPITGSHQVCAGSTIRLSDADAGGTWASSNTNIATVGSSSGIVTGIIAGNINIIYTSSLACTDTFAMTVNALPAAITGAGSVCVGSTTPLSNATAGGTWSSSNTSMATVGTISGIANGVAPGMPTITYTVPSGCIRTRTITVNTKTSAGTITGLSDVCVGASITLSDPVPAGVWSSSNTNATVSGSGVVTGQALGIDTIRYRVTSTCGADTATKVITISNTSNPGTITGPSSVCTGSSIMLSNYITGGTWSSSNTNATVSGSGVVTGVAAGISKITYAVNNGCGLATTTKTLTVTATPNAGTITGPSSVCIGSSINLTDNASGGIWSSSNTTATVVAGVVTGIAAGTDTIMYTVTNLACTTTATKIITINTPANAGSISGPSSVCNGFSIALSDAIPGGIWSSSNTTATVSASGVVTGAAAGIDTIMYSVTNGCGTAVATKIITVNPLPDAGTITGPSGVCVGSSIALSENTTGGVWSSSNTNAATVSGSGVVSGVAVGSTVIGYSVTNACGTIIASKIVFVNAGANAGTITGPSSVCAGSTITLLNAVIGGTWTGNNTNTTVSNTGDVTGNTPGTSVISYTVNNGCGTAVTTQTVTVNPLPNVGTISGPSNVCIGSLITLSDNVAGGTWSSNNTNATVAGGIVTGNVSGASIISYTISNGCGIATATKTITVDQLPNAALITGPSSVCVSSTIALTDAAAGGTWSSSNTNATVAGGIVTGNVSGVSIISYTISNGCGIATATKTITVDPLPDAAVITGPASVCVSSTIALTDAAPGGTWSSSNANATVAGGIVTGVTTGITTISYSVTNGCGTDVATKVVTISAQPNAGIISGPSNVCVASSMTLTVSGTSGVWSTSNTNATILVTTPGILVTGITAGTDIISYTVSTACGINIATKVVTINPLPLVPVITTQAASTTCTGTMYQNYGTSNLPQTGASYNWTTTNAILWAQGTGHQYSLISFTTPGTSTVTLNTSFASGCTSKSTVTVNVSTAVSATTIVSYFSNDHFVCTPNNEDSYQWGYDDVHSLDSTILTGEINQDYLNTNPDFANKYYWVMTTMGSCTQKTYYTVPTDLQNVNNDGDKVVVFPNPATNTINVTITSATNGNTQVEIINMMGQKVTMVNATNNKAVIDIAMLPAGYYLINCYRNNQKIANTRFIKN